MMLLMLLKMLKILNYIWQITLNCAICFINESVVQYIGFNA